MVGVQNLGDLHSVAGLEFGMIPRAMIHFVESSHSIDHIFEAIENKYCKQSVIQ
jgi:hypothetical protein